MLMNANMQFDQLCKRDELARAKATLAEYEHHLSCEGLTEAERDFLERGVAAQKERIERARKALANWWQ